MKLFLLFISVIIVTSCSIEKRLHQPGLNIEWKKKYFTKIQEEKDVYRIKVGELNDSQLESICLAANPVAQDEDIIECLTSLNNQAPEDFSFQQSKIVRKPTLEYLNLNSTSFKPNENIQSQKFKLIYKRGPHDNGGWLALLLFILIIAAGICAIILGHHVGWIVTGIVLIVLALIFLLVYYKPFEPRRSTSIKKKGV